MIFLSKKKILGFLANLDIAVAGVALVTLVTLTFMGVFMRYFMSKPFTWLEEVQLWCMVWVVYVSAGAAFRTGNHIAIEMLVDLFPHKIQRIVEIFIAAIVFSVLGYLFVQSVGFVELFIMNGRTTNMLNIPYTLIYGAIPISTLSMIISYGISLYKEVKSLNDKSVEVGE